MPSCSNTSARIATPPANDSLRSSVIAFSFRSRMCSSPPSSWMMRSRPSAPMSTAVGIELADAVADRAHGARAAHGFVEAAPAERRLVRLDGLARRDARALHALLREAAVGEEFLAQPHAAHLQALELERLQTLADDDLGAAAADVADQTAARPGRHGVRNAGIDEPRLFDAGDDFDGMADRLARALDECLFLASRAGRRWCRPRARCRAACRAAAGRIARGTRARAPRRPCSAGRRPRGRRRDAPSRAGDRG